MTLAMIFKMHQNSLGNIEYVHLLLGETKKSITFLAMSVYNSGHIAAMIL